MHYCPYFCYQFNYNGLAIFFYNIFLWLFRAGVHIASLSNQKANKWVKGRKNIFSRLEQAIPVNEKIIWMHCASLGEFEQGRPLLEKIKRQYPAYKILLTFFSPSGYEIQKNYQGVDWVFYLPMDGPKNARRFLEIVHPSLVIFIKYELWHYYLKKIKYRKIPLLLVSALFRKDMPFFKWYGGILRKMLSRFDQIFVQTKESKGLMNSIGLSHICTVSGDTRFDRVIEIAEKFEPIPGISEFIGSNKAIIAGSTWPEDEEVLHNAFSAMNDPSLSLIIAPHEISENHLEDLSRLFPSAIRFSSLYNSVPSTKVLIIDNVGTLSRLYKYSWLTYVGGGLKTKGLHNVLEAAVYNKIVLFGPYYHKYIEAVGLVKSGGGLPFVDEKKDGNTLKLLIETLLTNEEEFEFRSNASGEFVRSHKGASEMILHFIQEKRLLTN